LIRTRRGEFEDVVEALRQLEGVERVFPVLGRYDVVADVEASDERELGRIVLRMGRIAGVDFTESLIEIQHQEV